MRIIFYMQSSIGLNQSCDFHPAVLLSWSVLTPDCYNQWMISVSNIRSKPISSAINNRLYFAVIISLTNITLKILAIDCIMVLEQIVYNTNRHFVVTLDPRANHWLGHSGRDDRVCTSCLIQTLHRMPVQCTQRSIISSTSQTNISQMVLVSTYSADLVAAILC